MYMHTYVHWAAQKGPAQGMLFTFSAWAPEAPGPREGRYPRAFPGPAGASRKHNQPQHIPKEKPSKPKDAFSTVLG